MIIRRKIKYIFLCCLAMILSGCILIGVNEIKEDAPEVQWLRAIEDSNGSIFISDDGKQDTMWTSNIEFKYTPFQIVISSRYDPIDTIGSTARCSITIQHNSEKIRGGFCLYTKPKPDEPAIHYSTSIGNFHYVPDSVDAKILQTLNINGIDYKNCLVADSIDTVYFPFYYDNESNDSINGFAFSPEVGLLYYTFKDGRKYVRKAGKNPEEVYPHIKKKR